MGTYKKQLGQFFTANSDYILNGLDKRLKNKDVTDPFAGDADLMLWAEKYGAKIVQGFDVDKQYVNKKNIFFNDSLLNPKKYKFVLTNPPYLNINKASKQTKQKYFKEIGYEDLYQIALHSIMNSEEGIVIVPINFLSAENSQNIRNEFFHKFEIVEMNYFKHQVFADTTYNVIAFYYKRKKKNSNSFEILTHIYPDDRTVKIKLESKYNWTIGGEFVNYIKNQKNQLGIYRLTEEQIEQNRGTHHLTAAYNHVDEKINISVTEDMAEKLKANIILLKAIDSGSESGKIALENIKNYEVECLISKPTSRHMIHLIFDEQLSIPEQKELIKLFNETIEKQREIFNSLFLTNYRDNDRKRISFDFTYKLINHLYFTKNYNR